jgi:hypothetical protein
MHDVMRDLNHNLNHDAKDAAERYQQKRWPAAMQETRSSSWPAPNSLTRRAEQWL